MKDITYPEFYYSKEIESTFHAFPVKPAEVSIPILPKKPIEPKYSGSSWTIFLVVTLFFLIGGWMRLLEDGVDGLIVLCVLGTLVWFILLLISIKRKRDYQLKYDEYQEKKLKYRQEYYQYQIDVRDYEKKVKSRNKLIKEMSSYHYISEYRKNLLYSIFEKYVFDEDESDNRFAFCDTDDVKKGPAEEYFIPYLKQMHLYGDNYDVLTKVKVPAGNSFFYPDIVIRTYGMIIDIEIDEPYEMSDGNPIHYKVDIGAYSKSGIYRSIDSDRNDFFTRNGWCVIRFAEEQIFNFPDDCVKFIENFINYTEDYINYTLDDFCFDDYLSPTIKSINKWTKEEAHRMAYKKYRNKYLGRYLDSK